MNWRRAQPDLPPGWAWATVRDVADVALGKMLDAKRQTGTHAMQYLRNVNVQWHAVHLDDLLSMDIAPGERERYTVRAGDLLVCEGGEPGRCAIVPPTADGMGYQKALHRVRPSAGVDVRFLAYAFEHMARAGYLDESFTGSTIRHLPLEKIVALPLPVAPSEVQSQVADELASQLSIFDSAVTNLRALIGTVTVTPESRLGKLRKSLLAAAFAGRLVAEQRVDEPAETLLKRIQADREVARPQQRRRNRQEVAT